MKNKQVWNSETIKELLEKNDRAVARAILAIYQLQTQDEKSDHTTKHSNRVGFSASDAKKGSYYATWLLSGKNLSGWHLDNARKIAIKYREQLAKVAKQPTNQ
jgi:hypothetical protein